MTNKLELVANNNRKASILIVDDTESNIDILLELLNEYDLAVATDGLSAIEIANNEEIDLILLDIIMPEMDGYEVCKKLKLNNKTKYIPIIFITAKTDEDSIEKAYDIGGIDYVTKPFKPRELLARVKRELKLVLLIQNLNYLASHDPLTGIYNRRKFFELANNLYEISDELFIVMFDIDNFKAINDRYGHPVGDEVIKAVTHTISSQSQPDSVFGRLGGEEFAMVCTEKKHENISLNIEKLRNTIELLDIITDNNDTIKFTISSGIAKKQTDTINLDYLLKAADDALYEAKKTGRNKVVFRV